MPVKRRQIETDSGSYYNKRGWLEVFLDGKSAFFNGNESDDNDNDDENYENSEQQQLS